VNFGNNTTPMDFLDLYKIGSIVVLLLAVVTLVIYLHYQRTFYLEKLEERFVCYYCSHTFGLERLERVGGYDYCRQHGIKRQERLNV